MLRPTSIRFIDIAGSTGSVGEIIAADVNHDGNLDIVVASGYFPPQHKSVPISVFFSDGKGSFKLSKNPTSAETVHPREMIAADFNGDGIQDIFLADHGYDAPPFPGHTNTLLLGKAGGGYDNASWRLPKLPDFTHSADAADVDGDGDIDLYVGNYAMDGKSPYFLINNGSASFTQSAAGLPSQVLNGTHTYSTSLFVDADADGDKDLFLGGDGVSSNVFMNDGNGGFAIASAEILAGRFGIENSIAVDSISFDFNRDGRADVLAVGTHSTYQGASLQVLLSGGTNGLVDGTKGYFDSQPETTGWMKFTHFVDLNNDGSLDMVGETSGGEQGLIAYLNDGTNRFYQMRNDSLIEYGSGAMEVMDVDKDGRKELVLIRSNDGSFNIQIVKLEATKGNVIGTKDADTIFGDGDAGKIDGAGGADFLAGGRGNDTLIGGSGSDKLIGGSGADTASYATAKIAVGASLLRPSSNTGDAKGDVYSSIERLIGSSFSDKLEGNGGANHLFGGEGNDLLDGGTGADRITGGSGNDTYVIDNAADVVTEVAGGGTDLVQSSINWTMAANVERVTLTGAASIYALGNALSNVMTGNTGNNTLSGGAGNDAISGGNGNDKLYGGLGTDTLKGGSGSDVFVFNTALSSSTNKDTIVDFNVATDTTSLDNAIFTAIGANGGLLASAFRVGTAAADASDRIIYNSTTGVLIYDSNGSASGGAVEFAKLAAGLALTNADFFII